jgi:predicted O-methyltransferase YrrM
MRNFTFTEDWFIEDGLTVLNNMDTSNELHVLEIGSFEGKSTIWFLDKILQHQKSTITCVDPWLDYSQNQDSLNSYEKKNNEWKMIERGIKQNFLQNIIESGYSDKVLIRQGFSDKILPSLITEQKIYDIIFIDGNHTAPYVLMDAIMSWTLLRKGGIIIFDDYTWGLDRPTTLRPKESVDYFMSTFGEYVVELYSNYRKIVKKL